MFPYPLPINMKFEQYFIQRHHFEFSYLTNQSDQLIIKGNQSLCQIFGLKKKSAISCMKMPFQKLVFTTIYYIVYSSSNWTIPFIHQWKCSLDDICSVRLITKFHGKWLRVVSFSPLLLYCHSSSNWIIPFIHRWKCSLDDICSLRTITKFHGNG